MKAKMKESLLCFPITAPDLKAKLSENYDLLDSGPDDPAKLFSSEDLAKVRVTVTRNGGHGGMCKAVMDACPNLKLIVATGSGYDGVDLVTARARGIKLANSVGANSWAVADLALGLTLAATRSIARNDRYVRTGGWAVGTPSGVPMGLGMFGAKIGIYGMGTIGEKIAARAAAFESDVQYFSRRRIDRLPYKYHPTLEALAAWCDVLIVAVRAGPETKHAIDASILKLVGSKGFVVNVTRGLVIDESALIASLRSGAIAGAALDVFENEPKLRTDFLDIPNLVMTPHSGPLTGEAMDKMQQCVLDNVAAFYAGRPIPYEVTF